MLINSAYLVHDYKQKNNENNYYETKKRQYYPVRQGESRGSWRDRSPPPMCPRFDSRNPRHMWVEFVVGSLLCSERFFRVLRFSPLLENQHFQIPILAWKVSPASAKALDTFDTQIKVIYFYLF